MQLLEFGRPLRFRILGVCDLPFFYGLELLVETPNLGNVCLILGQQELGEVVESLGKHAGIQASLYLLQRRLIHDLCARAQFSSGIEHNTVEAS